jgi:hypothetical protein
MAPLLAKVRDPRVLARWEQERAAAQRGEHIADPFEKNAGDPFPAVRDDEEDMRGIEEMRQQEVESAYERPARRARVEKITEWLGVGGGQAVRMEQTMARGEADSRGDIAHTMTHLCRLLGGWCSWDVVYGTTPRVSKRGYGRTVKIPLAAFISTNFENEATVVWNLVDNRFELTTLQDWCEWFASEGGHCYPRQNLDPPVYEEE